VELTASTIGYFGDPGLPLAERLRADAKANGIDLPMADLSSDHLRY